MSRVRQNGRSRQTWTFVLALLCVVLVTVCGVIQVAHTHADGNANHADCSLCVTAHISVQPAAAAVVMPVAAVTTWFVADPQAIMPPLRPVHALFTRPPPASVRPS